MLYEDAYHAHLQRSPAELEWLVQTASEVFDNSDSNVLSGLDYSVQEAPSTHLQDIALRRCLVRLGRHFEGDHLLEIRGRGSEGYRLNPGEVPFHRPELILHPQARSWWRPDSVESFWQSNKILQVQEGVFDGTPALRLHLLLRTDEGYVTKAAARPEPLGAPLPSLLFTQGRAWQQALRCFLEPWGLSADDVVPALADPVADGSTVHVLHTARLPPERPLPERWVPRSLQQLRSGRLPPPLDSLLRRRHKALGGGAAPDALG